MPSKNNISQFLKPQKKEAILPASKEEKENLEPKKKSPTSRKQVRGVTKETKIGRPKKSQEEKRSFKVVLSLTPSEGENLQKKSGLIDNATYVYSELKKSGILD